MSVTYQLRESETNMRDPHCPVFALIVGIDEYLSNAIPDLRGCVNDALTMKTYLTNRFHIPEAHIVLLTNADATRESIISIFQSHLIHNPSIEKNDAIVVYYAGHGSRAPAPSSWPSTDGKIETIVPHDERTETDDGETVHGIPDRTINTLLGQLASARGNNITVILDCCHSASGTRGARAGILPVPRFAETFVPIPEDLDQDLFGRKAQVSLPPGIAHNFMDSHVLLAACQQHQRAQECISTTGNPCGFFTDSLITQLRRIRPNRITYADLLDLLPTLPDQNPQCEGSNQHRYMFEVEGPRRDRRTYTLAVKEDGTLVVDAGGLHGVVVGTQFSLEKSDRILVAASVNPVSTVLVPAGSSGHSFPDKARLIVCDWKNDAAMLKVYLHASDNPPFTVSDVSTHGTGSDFLLVESLEEADLAVSRASEEEFCLTRLDTKIPRYVAPDVHLAVPDTNLPCVLDAVAHFNYFLGKHNGHDPFAGEVELEMYSLRGEYGARVPNLDVGNLVVDNEVRFRVEGKYGLAICNYSQHALFPYLLYFDPATYSIDAWYVPESRAMAAPLPPAKSPTEPTRITVGYGAEGGYAFEFFMPEGLTSDSGFLKLFLSTEFLDLKRVEQLAAVDLEPNQSRNAEERRPAVEAEMWGTLDVAVTLYREDSGPPQV
ncbi:caspase domain-containing protein [Mycena vitilis]|nr:caspase domain-containing protein [Mycena vitilis]